MSLDEMDPQALSSGLDARLRRLEQVQAEHGAALAALAARLDERAPHADRPERAPTAAPPVQHDETRQDDAAAPEVPAERASELALAARSEQGDEARLAARSEQADEPARAAQSERSQSIMPAAAGPRARLDTLMATARERSWETQKKLEAALTPEAIMRRLRAWAVNPRAWLIAASLLIGLYAWGSFLRDQYSWPHVWIWLGGLAAFLLLVAEWPLHRPIISRGELAAAALVLLTGIALRIYGFDDIPYGMNNDASYSGVVAINAAHSSSYFPWSPDPTQGETFFDYWIVAMMHVVGTTSAAIRGAAALAGSLTVIGMYLFTRQLLGMRVALIATTLFGASGWHIIFSRAGWRVITLPLVEAFALYLLFRAFQTRRRGSFALAGALLALQIDTYPAGRIIPVLAGIWALVELWRGPDRLGLIRGYLLLGVSFLFAGASVLSFAHVHPDLFNARYNDVNTLQSLLSGDWTYLWEHVQMTAGVFTARANGNDFFLEQPLLDLPARWLYEAGLAVAVWYLFRRSYRYAFVLLGLVLTLAPGFVSQFPNGNRVAGTMIFVYILAALPLELVFDVGAQVLRGYAKWTRTIPALLVVYVLLVSVTGTFTQYLGPDRQYLYGFGPQTAAVASYIRTIENRYEIHIVDNDPFGIDALAYLTWSPGDPPVGLDAGGNPATWQHFIDTGTHDLPVVTIGPQRGLAIILPFDDIPKAAAALRMYPAAREYMLGYTDGPLFGQAARIVLAPPRGGSIAPTDIPGPAIIQ